MKKLCILFVPLTASHTLWATDFNTNGQVRIRHLASDLEALQSSEWSQSTESRVRLGLKAQIDSTLGGFVEFQDSRRWGSEQEFKNGVPQSKTIGNSHNTDLHQAWIHWNGSFGQWKLGRQKVAWGSQRLLSSLEWHPNARVFDGLTTQMPLGKAQIQGIGAWIADTNATKSKDQAWISGAHVNIPLFQALSVELYGLYDQSRLGSMGFPNWDLAYLGQRIVYKDGLYVEEETILQLGEVGTQESFAWQLALRAGFQNKDLTLSLGYDAMSGDQDPKDQKSKVYLNPYSFGHQYFGWMDYVISNKADTKSQGIQDYRIDFSWTIPLGELQFAAHHFSTQTAGDPLGQEFDLQWTYKAHPKLTIPIGAGLFIPGDSANKLSLLKGKDHATWQVYTMPTLNF
jgi:hypothetical protein